VLDEDVQKCSGERAQLGSEVTAADGNGLPVGTGRRLSYRRTGSDRLDRADTPACCFLDAEKDDLVAAGGRERRREIRVD
jgi:hypothetical protein